MIFDTLTGNSQLKDTLAGMVRDGRVPHALMFYENDGCGAILLALGMLEMLTGSGKVARLVHPDVHFIFPVTKGSKVSTDKPDSGSYLKYWNELLSSNPYFLEDELNDALGIEGKSSVIANSEAKNILDKLSLHSLEGGYRAIVVYLPEKMNKECANRLLKSIEEPPEQTLFIFITHVPEKVMVTISSRCQAMRVLPLSKDEVREVLTERFGKSPQEAAEAAEMSGGSVGRALSFLSGDGASASEKQLFFSLMDALLDRDLLAAQAVGDQLAALPSREKAKAFCRYASEGLRKIFLVQQGLTDIASMVPSEAEAFSSYASHLRKSFSRSALPCLDEAMMLIERNINLKILFCDLVNSLYMTIHGRQ